MRPSQVKEARKHYPLAPARQATNQAIRLVLAKEYLTKKNIYAIVVGSDFKYGRSTGTVLS